MTPDTELLRRYSHARSEAAFTELVQRHMQLVYSVALRQLNGDIHLAHDATQVVFTALARKARALEHHSTLTGWLYVSTHLAAAQLVRTEQRRRIRETTAEAMNMNATPETGRVTDSLLPIVERVLIELKDRERDAIMMRFLEQRSFADIARALQTSEDGARKRVDRALEKLRKLLGRHGVTSSSAAIGAVLGCLAVTSAPTPAVADVAAAALTNAPAGTGAGLLGSILKSFTTLGGVTAAAMLVVLQHQANVALREERDARLAAREAVATATRETDALTARLRAAHEANRMPAATAATPAAQRASRAPSRPLLATLRITPEHTIEWNGEPVTLDDFVAKLKAAGADISLLDSRLVVQANGVHFAALSYLIDESRKARINHLMIDSNATPVPTPGVANWF